MSEPTPIVDPRDAAAVRAEVTRQLHSKVPEWSQTKPDQASAALIGVFGRFCEIVIQRLNKVPDKNLLAFLDLLGLSRQPPQPARVPITFTLAPGSVSDAVVPAGTQVAAPAAEGEKDPVVFETERELTVVGATLQTLISVDADRDMVANHSALLANPSAQGARIFAGDRFNEHVLYIGHADLGIPNVSEVRFELISHGAQPTEPGAILASDLRWETWDGVQWRPISLDDVSSPVFLAGTFTFTNRRPTPPQTIGGVTSCWMRCRPPRPISPGPDRVELMTPAALLPSLANILVSVDAERSGFRPDVVLVNGQEADVTKPFHPFGERPKLGDTMYIGSREAVGRPSTVTLQLPLINPSTVSVPGSAIPPVRASEDLVLRWEAWNGAEWSLLGETSPTPRDSGSVVDGTFALTMADSTTVVITLDHQTAPTTVNGITNHWLRVSIDRGNYGVEAQFVRDGGAPGGFTLEPATFAPPVLQSIGMSYTLEIESVPADVVAYNNLEFDNLRAAFAQNLPGMPFRALPALPPALYMAFALPSGRREFPMRAVSLYHGLKLQDYAERVTPLDPEASIQTTDVPGVQIEHRYSLTNTGAQTVLYRFEVLGGLWVRHLSRDRVSLAPGEDADIIVTVTVPDAADLPAGRASDSGSLSVMTDSGAFSARFETRFETRAGAVPSRRRSVRWEYWNGSSWATLSVLDATEALTRSGVVEFLGPSDIALAKHFELSGYWVRALCDPGEETVEPRLRTLLPNTTFAAQNTTVRNELLGSSDATASQRFQTTRSPVLFSSQQLEVREPGPLTREDLEALQAAHGESGVTPVDGSRVNEAWVRWVEVPDLYGSGPQGRHYVLDHVTGQVTFGNGAQGRIPPRGAGNVRMALYQTGGGSVGNRAAGTIVQMKTTVPYISAVSNPEAAAGGFAAEDMSAVIARGPRTLRHGGRAVAVEDYEDLARLASPEVSRAKCVPLRLLRNDPLGITEKAGAVSVIVVPGTADPKPVPSLELLTRVENFLRTRQVANVDVDVVGPLYVRVDVHVEVVLARLDGSSKVDVTIRARLAAFLHPLTGGRDGTGWDFGRRPQLSDLHAVVGSVPGVDHIQKLSMTQEDEFEGEGEGVRDTGRFLVYSGQHQVLLTFAGAK